MKKSNKINGPLFSFVLGLLFASSFAYVYASFASSIVTYDTNNSSLTSTNVQGAVDELYNKCLVEKLSIYGYIKDNAEIDSSLDFSAISSDTNGNGVYIRSGTENDDYPIYYYRGNVTNNHLIFGGFCWRIVRTTDNGGLKLIYNGTPTEGKCIASGTATQLSSTSKFNTSTNRNAYVGYMYGSTASTATYTETHTNTTNSTIKTAVDNWYSSNLTSYTSQLDDIVFCNDRSLQTGSGTYTTGTSYKPYNRLYTNKTPTLNCPIYSNDLFTTSSASIGNNALTYPVGLITADEVAFAGGKNATNNTSYYLYTGQDYYTASPYRFFNSSSYMYYVNTNGSLANGSVTTAYGVRPVVVLKAGYVISSGKGLKTSPYVVS